MRYALRSLTRSPGFFGLALATLTLGIGATTVMFSITESVLWRSYSFAGAERLVWLTEFNLKVNPLGNPVSAPKFREWRDKARSFSDLAAMTYGESHSLTGSAERVRSNTVSAGFFETLRVRPSTGRTFAGAEEQSPDSRPVILADAFWRRHFSGAAFGLGAALVLGRLLKSALYLAPHLHPGLLHGVAVNDPASLAGAAFLLLGVAAVAGITPAARASHVEPCDALRQD